jgi:hypothetical protein
MYHDIMKEHMERFPARLPAQLKEALDRKARALGTSMNELVVIGVRNVVEGSDLIVAPSGVVDAHEDLVLFAIEGEIGPAKGIARHYMESGQPRLGALLYWFAAQMQTDPREKAKELVRSAGQIRDLSRPIAIALLRAALECNPASDVAKSRLGQILHYEGDHAGAKAMLESVRADDNYARLSYGWSCLELAGEDQEAARSATDEIAVSLRRWALGDSSPVSRNKWINQVARLKDRGSRFQQTVEDLINYSNDNASWKPINMAEIQPHTKPESPDLNPQNISDRV